MTLIASFAFGGAKKRLQKEKGALFIATLKGEKVITYKTKNFGIQFGYYVTGYGIGFQASYSGMIHRPLAGIYMGDTVLNMGQYLGSTFNLGDLWANAGNLYYKGNSGNSHQVKRAGKQPQQAHYPRRRNVKRDPGA